jgi:hypothetical protein
MSGSNPPLKRFARAGRLSLQYIAEALGQVPADQPVLICADELVADCTLELGIRSLYLHVRVLSCPAPAALSFGGSDGAASWRVFFGRIEGEAAQAFALRFMGLRVPLDAGAARPRGCALRFAPEEEGARIELAELADLPGDPLVLMSVLQSARSLRVRAPQDAAERARWVVSGTAGDAAQARLFAESTQLLSVLRSPARRFALVPYLDRRLYVAQAQALMDALEAVEADLRVVDDRQHDLAARRRAAQGLLARVANAARLARHLREQSEKNLEEARRLLEQKGELLQAQLAGVTRANSEFEAGLEQWKWKQIVWASLKATVGIGIAIASVCTANPAGAAGGTAMATEAGVAAAAAAGRIARLVAAIKRIVEAVGGVEALKGILDGLDKVREAVAAGISAVELAARIQRDWKALPDAGTSIAAEDWDLIVEDLGPLLQPAVAAEVPGAQEYLGELRKLAIRGKAKFFAQEHVIEEAQRFLQLVWTLEREEADHAVVESEIEAIAEGEPLQESLRLRFEQARDDIKARVVLAIDNLAAAHHYFALDEGQARADPAMSATELRAALGRAADDLVQAYERFDPRPQRWTQRIPVDFDAASRDQFASHGTLSIELPLDAENFPHYARIRVSRVRAYLRGARCPPGKEILLQVSTSDHYRDRYGSPEPRLFDFAGRPLRLGFGYRHRPGVSRLPLEGDPEASAEVSYGGEPIAGIEGVYFEPTPFTEWRVSLPPEGNPHLDLFGCERIELEFTGSAVMTGFRAMAPGGETAPAPALIGRVGVEMLPAGAGGDDG